MKRTSIIAALTCLMLPACVYPAYRTLQPGLTVSVLDESGSPVPDAKVVLITRISPPGPRDMVDESLTDASGQSIFAPRREWQTETTMMHGSLNYSWTLCIEKPGYTTFLSRDLHSSDQEKTIRMTGGTATPCR